MNAIQNRRLALSLLLATAVLPVALLPAIASAQELPPPGSLAAETARDYRQAARYPESSTVIAPGGRDPIREKRATSAVTAGRVQDGGSLSVIGGKISYEFPSAIDFYATVRGGQVATITGEVLTEEGKKVGTIRFFDDGVGLDLEAGDGIYSGRVDFDSRPRPRLADSYLVKVDAGFVSGLTQTAVSGFLYTRPHAKLTGSYRDVVRNGNLVVEAQVEVKEAGRFHLAGTLATLNGEPIGTAQAAQRLEPGRHWIALEFYGLMFHDRGAAGRFRLASVALSTVTAMPNAQNDLVENAFTTRAVTLDSLTRQGFGRPELLEAANRLEIDAAAALGNQ